MSRAAAVFLLAILVSCRGRLDREALYRRAGEAQHAGRLAEAGELARRGAAFGPAEERWRFRLLEAEILLDAGEGTKARARLQEEPPTLPSLLAARRVKVLGQIASALGELAEAERRFQEAASLAANAPTALALEIAYRQGQVLARRRQDERARAVLRAVVARASAASEPRWQGAALVTLSYLALRQQRWTECADLAHRAVEDLTRAGAELARADALDDLGICAYRLGDFERSRLVLEQAVAIKERLGSMAGLSTSLGSLGAMYVQAAETRRALPPLERALALAVAHRPEEAASRAVNLALAHIDLKSWEQAERFNDQAARLARDQKDEGTLSRTILNAGLIAQGRGDLAAAEGHWRQLLDVSGDREIATRARARLAALYGRMGRHRAAGELFAAALADADAAWAALSEDQDRLTFMRRYVRLYKDHVSWLVGQGRRDEALQAVEASRAWALIGRAAGARPVTAADLRDRARRRGEILVSYWLGEERSQAWVVTAARVDMVELPPQERINAAVLRYRAFIDGSPEDPRADGSPGRDLYDLIVAPLRPFIPAGARVVIATDGTLHGVPFAALVAPAPPHYWIEEATLAEAPSLAALPAAPPPARAPAVLAIGDPQDGGPDFPRLPYVAAEIAALQRHYPGGVVTAKVGAQARPEAYLGGPLDRFSIVHLGAHAVASREGPLDSKVVLSGGALSVRQVMRTPLTADLVTLSACRGAETRNYSGEGLVGLAWGFLLAGARHVIGGMWDVPDRSTADLMDRLYAAVEKGSAPAEALRTAQLALARSRGPWRTPYYWAAFNVYIGPGPQRR
jgi:CHAT domain-containing protein